MSTFFVIASSFTKIIKLIVNIIILAIYRFGNTNGRFLGIGGTWNLNEEKDADSEILASGVFLGYFIYTAVSFVATLVSKEEKKFNLRDVLMNLIGSILWISTSIIALHYWIGYQENLHGAVQDNRSWGIFLGILCVISSLFYLLDLFLTCIHMSQEALKE